MIATISTLGELAQTAGVVVAALLAAAVLLARSDRARSAAMLGALVLTPVLLVANIWSTPQLQPLRDRPLLALVAAVAGALLLAAGAWAIHRRPELVALGAAFALPFRIPIESGGDTANLLLPLYLVIAAGVLAYAVPRLRATPGLDDDDEPPGRARRRPARWSGCSPASVVLYAAQSAYSSDFDRALSQVIFFYVPFALLFALLVRVDWTPRLAGQCLAVLLALAVVFVGIGFVEYSRRELLLNPKVISSNQFESYFRVNSLFFDPNIYGRFLAAVMLGLAAVLLWSRDARVVAGEHGRARGPVGGARADAVAVVVHGPARGPRRARRAALGRAPGGGRGRGVRGRGRRRRARGAGRGRGRRLRRQRHERALEPRHRRPRAGPRAAGRRLRGRLLPPRVPPPGEELQRARLGGVAHDPDHGRRRAGRRRAAAVPRAARRRRCAACCAARASRSRARRSRRRSWRSSCTRCCTRRSSRTRWRGRCWRSGPR